MNCYFLFTEVKSLISQCLSIRHTNRPTIDQIYAHPWLRAEKSSLSSVEDISTCCIASTKLSTNNSSSGGSVESKVSGSSSDSSDSGIL